jgi:hypothetical protein
MGLESECTVRVGRKTFAGKALIESDKLHFRGELTLDIPFEAMREVEVDEGSLVVRTDEQAVSFALSPPVADRWMRLIKEPKGLFEKLEVGSDARVAVVDVFDAVFLTALRDRAASMVEGRVPERAPVVFFGADSKEALRKIPLVRARMAEDGVLWIVRPKSTRALSEADVADALRTSALVETKVVAFSKTHLAHRCSIPPELRGRAIPRPPIVSVPPPAPDAAGQPVAAQAKVEASDEGEGSAKKAGVASRGKKAR